VTLIQLRAQETGVPLARMAVSIVTAAVRVTELEGDRRAVRAGPTSSATAVRCAPA
jgi:hypothetical protein